MNRPFNLLSKVLGNALFIIFSFFGMPALGQTEADSIWTFSQIREDRNADNVLDHLGDEVTITGIANTNSGLLHESYLQIFIQNDSAGMSVFAMKIDTPVVTGDSLVVRGVIEEYNGLAEVHANSYQVYQNASHEPDTKPLHSAIKAPSQYLGMLVEGEGSVIEKGSTFNGKYIRISQQNIPGSMMVYVSNFHSLFDNFEFDLLSIGDKVKVKGVVTEYNPDFPETRTYKMFLRTPSDMKYVGIPRYYLYLIFGGILLTAIIVTGWVLVLRRQVDSKTSEIKNSLKEKEVLLREIHHRVKNSLSIISGLIELQLGSTDSEDAKSVLKDSQARIRSVGLIHEKLYNTDSLSDIELDNYIQELVEAIHSTFTKYKDSVDLEFDLDKVKMDIDRVIPCGLLINELVVNAFKHAFSKEGDGKLTISLKDQDEMLRLTVADDGPGLPEDYEGQSDESLGTMLIESFTDQLKAEMEISELEGGGASFSFLIPMNNK